MDLHQVRPSIVDYLCIVWPNTWQQNQSKVETLWGQPYIEIDDERGCCGGGRATKESSLPVLSSLCSLFFRVLTIVDQYTILGKVQV